MGNGTIYLQNIGKVNPIVANRLKKDLSWYFEKFRLKVVILPEIMPLNEDFFHEAAQKYHIDLIHEDLIKTNSEQGNFPVLGILDFDVYRTGRHCVFGVADNPIKFSLSQPGAAVISITRLRETFYNRNEDAAIEEKRIFKEALHEIGHALGLDHCENECVMQFSQRIWYVDQKPAKYCDVCCQKLKNLIENWF